MAKITRHDRLRVGLIFTGSSDWVGGLYYIHNIIRSLLELPEEKKPYLLIIPDWKTPIEYITTHGYPYADIFSLSEHTLFKRAYNKFYKTLTSKNLFYDWMTESYRLDWLYPFHDFRPELDSVNEKKISWIYDFQHKLLPELFTKEELARREKEFSLILSKSRRIVVSSHDSLNHLKRFYPNSRASVRVLQFVSIIDRGDITPMPVLKERYKIKTPYFIVSNQFWQHKNHQVVLAALQTLKTKGRHVNILFTGKESDHRNPQYVHDLKKFVKDNGLESMTSFLGFIPRADQLGLMLNALAVIQPSKFEGWGTVVEDAKVLKKPIILSDIAVHREQMLDKGYYFSPDDKEKLAFLLEQFSDPGFQPVVSDADHEQKLKKFAEDFIRIFEFQN